jgi:hypothetical protein
MGLGSLVKAGAASFAALAVERELRYCEDRAACIEDRVVHFALVVGENSQMGAFLSAKAQFALCIAGAEAEEEEEAGADLTVDSAIDFDAGLPDALDEDSQASLNVLFF